MKRTALCFVIPFLLAASLVSIARYASAEVDAGALAGSAAAPAASEPTAPGVNAPVLAPAPSSTTVTTVTTTVPSDKLHNVVDDPVAAIDDLRNQKTQSWAVAILAALVITTSSLAQAAKKWPDSRALAWFAKNKTALFVIQGVGMSAAAAFNALALGGAWMAAVYAAGVAFFTLLHNGMPAKSA